jgi:hypothetical protein
MRECLVDLLDLTPSLVNPCQEGDDLHPVFLLISGANASTRHEEELYRMGRWKKERQAKRREGQKVNCRIQYRGDTSGKTFCLLPPQSWLLRPTCTRVRYSKNHLPYMVTNCASSVVIHSHL